MSLTVGVIGVAISFAIGIVVGGVSGYYAGVLDTLLQRLIEILLSVPRLPILLALATVIPASWPSTYVYVGIVAVLSMIGWAGLARVIRGQVLAMRSLEYVTAARATGVRDLRIILRHIVPSAFFPFLVYSSLDMGNVVIVSSALSFLGLGTEIGYADWGQLIALSRRWILGAPGHALQFWYTIAYPAAVITLFVLAWNILGDAVRDVLDPRLRGRRAA